MIAAVLSVIIFNFLFTTPRYTFHAYGEGYPVTFLIMFGNCILTGTLALKLKNQSKTVRNGGFPHKDFGLIQTRFWCARGRKKSSVKRDSSLETPWKKCDFYGVKDHELEKSKVFMMEDSGVVRTAEAEKRKVCGRMGFKTPENVQVQAQGISRVQNAFI